MWSHQKPTAADAGHNAHNAQPERTSLLVRTLLDRLVVGLLECVLKSILLDLDLDLDLGRFVTKSNFNFYCAYFVVLLFRPYDIWPTCLIHITKDLRYFT